MSSTTDRYADSKISGISQSLIDTATFWVSNSLLHEVSGSFPSPKMEKVVIFGAADLLIRNGWIDFLSDYSPLSGQYKKNMYIALVSFFGATVIDLLKKDDMKNSIMKNLLLNAVGFGGNSVVDNLIPEKYI